MQSETVAPSIGYITHPALGLQVGADEPPHAPAFHPTLATITDIASFVLRSISASTEHEQAVGQTITTISAFHHLSWRESEWPPFETRTQPESPSLRLLFMWSLSYIIFNHLLSIPKSNHFEFVELTNGMDQYIRILNDFFL